MGGDDGVGLAPPQSQEQLAPRSHLDVAGRAELEADGARQIDVEADERPILVVEVERGKVAFGEKAHDDAPRWLIGIGGRCRRRVRVGVLSRYAGGCEGEHREQRQQRRYASAHAEGQQEMRHEYWSGR